MLIRSNWKSMLRALTLQHQATFMTPSAKPTGRLTSIADRNINTVSLNYDGSGNLATVQDTVGRTINFTYDAQGRITQIILPTVWSCLAGMLWCVVFRRTFWRGESWTPMGQRPWTANIHGIIASSEGLRSEALTNRKFFHCNSRTWMRSKRDQNSTRESLTLFFQSSCLSLLLNIARLL